MTRHSTAKNMTTAGLLSVILSMAFDVVSLIIQSTQFDNIKLTKQYKEECIILHAAETKCNAMKERLVSVISTNGKSTQL